MGFPYFQKNLEFFLVFLGSSFFSMVLLFLSAHLERLSDVPNAGFFSNFLLFNTKHPKVIFKRKYLSPSKTKPDSPLVADPSLLTPPLILIQAALVKVNLFYGMEKIRSIQH